MNIFNELLKSGQNTMTNMITNNLGMNGYNNNNNGNNAKQQKLRGQLHTCTYSDDKKFIIQKAIKQAFHVYPTFDTDILSFKQNNVQRRYLELKAILQIEVRGKICKVDFNMMIPANFPIKPPYVRIINRNPEFVVDDYYRPLQSPSDQKSYILNERLNEIKTWDQNKSIVNVIIECYDLLRNRFPFSKSGGKNSTVQNQNSPWQAFNNNQGFNNNQPTGYNNNNVVNNPNSGFTNYIQGGGFGSQNYQMGQMGQNNPNYGFNQNNSKPPIPFSTGNMNQIIANGQKFAGTSKQTLEKLKTQHIKSLESVQALDVLRYSIQSQESFLRKQNVEMNNFLSANENNQPSQSLNNLVKPMDDLSEQILDLISSIKSREDCANELESKFNDGALTLDDFMKHFRKIEENKFQEKVLLAKCVNVSQKY